MLRWVLAFALALSAPVPVVAADTDPHAQIMTMPPELRSRLHEVVLSDDPPQAQRLERLIRFVFDAEGLGMSYQEDATYSVDQAYATRKANCLTFTLLFLALAREAGLDAYAQEIGETLAWHQDDDTIYRNNHVNAGVRVGKRQYTVDVIGDSVIALKRPAAVSDRRLLAHYYNNLSISELQQDQMVPALQNMSVALEFDPDYATHWSNAGVLYLRNGDPVAAERAYERALALDPVNAGALFNMAGLAHRNGDRRREAEFQKRLASVQKKDPFHQFLRATDYERAGDYPRAIEHYRRAIRLHRDEHRFYSALARAYLRTGDTRRAGKALVRAQALSNGETRAAYRAQLDSLRRMSN
jgi:Flp pilus assembly protein TadD